MAREILFRGKRIDNGEWVEGCLLIDYVSGQYFIHANGNSVNESDNVGEEGFLRFVAFEVDSETVCQYTGRTDRNGRQIFERDILKIGNEFYTVVWDEDMAGYTLAQCGVSMFSFGGFFEEDMEVAGNIVDNPELIEEG